MGPCVLETRSDQTNLPLSDPRTGKMGRGVGGGGDKRGEGGKEGVRASSGNVGTPSKNKNRCDIKIKGEQPVLVTELVCVPV